MLVEVKLEPDEWRRVRALVGHEDAQLASKIDAQVQLGLTLEEIERDRHPADFVEEEFT